MAAALCACACSGPQQQLAMTSASALPAERDICSDPVTPPRLAQTAVRDVQGQPGVCAGTRRIADDAVITQASRRLAAPRRPYPGM